MFSYVRRPTALRLGLFLLVLTSLLILVACGPAAEDEDPGDGQDPVELTGEPIKVGVLSPFTGPFASVGSVKTDTFNMLLDDANAAGGINGRPLEYVVGDSQGKADEARTQALRLIEQEKVDVLVGAYLSEETVEAMEVAADEGIPFLIPTSAANEINAVVEKEPEKYRHIFRAGYNITQWAQMMGDFIIDQGATSYGYVGANIRWNREFAEELKQYLDEQGIKPVFEDKFYSPAQPEFESAVQDVQDTRPDIVVLGDPGQNAVELARRIRAADIDTPLFSVGGQLGDERAAATIEPLGELYFQAAAWRQSSPEAEEYFERFQAEAGYPLVGYTDILTHDTIKILIGALRAAEEITPEAISEALVNGEFEGLAGKYTFGPGHQPPWQAGTELSGVVVQWVAPGDGQIVWPE